MRAALGLMTAAVLLAAPSHALAQAADPVITKLNRSKAAPGSIVVISGRNFGADKDKIRVEVEGKECLVTEVADTQITCMVNLDCKLGNTALQVIVSGRKASISLELITFEELQKSGDEMGEDKSQQALNDNLDVVKVTALEVTTKDGLPAFRVKGETKDLLDGMSVRLTVKFNGEALSADAAEISGNAFDAVLPPLKGAPLPGPYVVESVFMLRLQPRKLKKELRDKMDKDKLEIYNLFQGSSAFDIGDSAEAKQLAATMKKTYEEILGKLDKVFEESQKAYASTGRTYFRDGRKIDNERWKAWLWKEGFITETGQIAELEKMNDTMRGPYINQDAWERLVKKQIEAVREQYATLLETGRKYVVSRYPTVDENAREGCAVLVEMLLERTQNLYERNEIKPSDKLRENLGAKDMPRGRERSPGAWEARRRKCELELNPPKSDPADGASGG